MNQMLLRVVADGKLLLFFTITGEKVFLEDLQKEGWRIAQISMGGTGSIDSQGLILLEKAEQGRGLA